MNNHILFSKLHGIDKYVFYPFGTPGFEILTFAAPPHTRVTFENNFKNDNPLNDYEFCIEKDNDDWL